MTIPPQGTAGPSRYELNAWNDLISDRARPTRRAAKAMSGKAGDVASRVAGSGAGKAIAKGARSGGSALSNAVPDSVKRAAHAVGDSGGVEWVGEAAHATGKTLARVARVGLTPNGVVKKHQRRGHAVERLLDIRSLDLEQVDHVRGRNLDLAYAAIGAASGAGTGFFITGGEVAVSSGAGAAPGAGVVAGAIAADLAAVIGLSSRAVGQVALAYGYDPDDPTEKAFVASVINLSAAGSTAAKEAAFADIVRLTGLLVRGKAWTELNKSVLARAAQEFMKAIGRNLTKRSLGKLVPVVGIGVGAAINFATLEGVVDSANIAYRRRFLLEKYPQLSELGDVDVAEKFADQVDDTVPDETFTVDEILDELEEQA